MANEVDAVAEILWKVASRGTNSDGIKWSKLSSISKSHYREMAKAMIAIGAKA